MKPFIVPACGLSAILFLTPQAGAEGAIAAAERLGLDCTGQGIYGQEHARWHQKYKKMHNQNGAHCCNEGDCRPSVAVFDTRSQRWLTCISEQPRFIEAQHHVKDAYGMTSFASVCANRSNESSLYCFVPPDNPG